MARSEPPMTPPFVAELVRRLHGHSAALALPLSWLEQRLAENHQAAEHLVQLEAQHQAAEQVSVSNSIVSLRLLAATDWRPFVENLSSVERTLRGDPAAVYGRSRVHPRRWYRPLLEYVVFALVPAIPLFRLHQWVAYGGTFGEYYTYGLQAYLLGFAAYWWTFTIYLVLYAAVLRAAAEGIVLTTAWIMPARVARVRTVVEWVYLVLYFGSVPAFLIRIAMLS